ncbi:MAG: phosphoenolpyruvate--protein phosphotransferase [Ignavibacteria bacterium]|nr:phosphoenolpyruvate--protein phosphotransferase [Ignavibacteria bacterium]
MRKVMSDQPRQANEILLKGIPAAPGIAIGPSLIFHKTLPIVEERLLQPSEVEAELDRLRQAVARSKKELQKIFRFAEEKLGDEEGKIFEAQLLILEDSVLFDTIFLRIRTELRNAGYIVYDEIEKYHRLMASSRDEYTRERALDVEDLRNRILRNLQEEKLVSKLQTSAIVVSHVLAAADTLILSRNDILGYLTEVGGVTSHTALLARALKIPAVVGVRHVVSMVKEGTPVIIDGYGGNVIIHPSEETLRFYQEKKRKHKEFEDRLADLRDLPAETPDGRQIELVANVELVEELEFVHVQGADGIGLYRSETLLLGKEVFPTEDEQADHYALLADSMFPKMIVIRTFDIGGDKMMAHPVRESNPFLGWRGIRVMLDKTNVFMDQLRAILRASSRKNVKIMFPMVSNIKELREARRYLEEAKRDLVEANIPFDEKIKVGVMIEVPAAAVITEDLAKEVDFLSIGTNDLIQYLLAVDRSNDIVSSLYQEFHPAVVRFLRRIIERGKKEGVTVGMCGEMAGDPLATVLLLGLGLDEFSVVPMMLPEIKKIIRSTKYRDARRVAKHVLSLQTEDEVKSYLLAWMKKRFPDIPQGEGS